MITWSGAAAPAPLLPGAAATKRRASSSVRDGMDCSCRHATWHCQQGLSEGVCRCGKPCCDCAFASVQTDKKCEEIAWSRTVTAGEDSKEQSIVTSPEYSRLFLPEGALLATSCETAEWMPSLRPAQWPPLTAWLAEPRTGCPMQSLAAR